MNEALAACKSASPDALVYFGLGSTIARLPGALKSNDWDPPRVMCTAFVGATYSKAQARQLDGWVGVDQYDERNTVLTDMLSRHQARHGTALVPNSATSTGHDTGRMLALGLSRMRIASPSALRDALETIRREPAATGAPGTIITFGPQCLDHRGYKGAHFLILRKAQNETLRRRSPRRRDRENRRRDQLITRTSQRIRGTLANFASEVTNGRSCNSASETYNAS